MSKFFVRCEVEIQPHSFGCECPIALFAEKTVLSPLNGLVTLVKSPLTICVRVYFWTLNSVLLIFTSIPMPGPHYFDYYSFVISFKTGKCGNSLAVQWLGLHAFTANGLDSILG